MHAQRWPATAHALLGNTLYHMPLVKPYTLHNPKPYTNETKQDCTPKPITRAQQ